MEKDETVGTPKQDVNSIYVSDTLFEKDICGVLFKWRELPGEDIMNLYTDPEVRKVIVAEGKKPVVQTDEKIFNRKLIEACVVDPPHINVKKLKPVVYTLLSAEIQASFGLNEVVQKNLEAKFTGNLDSTP